MSDGIFDEIKQTFAEALDRFFIAFTRIYEGIFDEKLRENIHGYDFVIVVTSVGFVLFFLRAEIASIFTYFGKSRHEDHRRERIKRFIQDDDEDTDVPPDHR